MRHHKDSSQCYRVYVVKDAVEEVSPRKPPLLPVEYTMVNSIDTIEET